MTAALALIVAAILTAGVWLMGWALARFRERSEAQSMREAATGILTSAFAYGVDKISSSALIDDLEGNTLVHRELLGLKPNEGFCVHRIRGFFAGSGRLSSGPSLEYLRGTDITYRFDASTPDPTSGAYTVRLDRGLEHGASVDLAVSVRFEKLHKMSRADVRREYRNDRFRYEYHGFRVDIPIGVLHIELRFPKGFEADFGATAFYGSSESVADEERRRIAGMLHRNAQSVALTVEGPHLALQYAIYWMPKR